MTETWTLQDGTCYVRHSGAAVICPRAASTRAAVGDWWRAIGRGRARVEAGPALLVKAAAPAEQWTLHRRAPCACSTRGHLGMLSSPHRRPRVVVSNYLLPSSCVLPPGSW